VEEGVASAASPTSPCPHRLGGSVLQVPTEGPRYHGMHQSAHYLWCHHDGHQARAYKRPRSPELPSTLPHSPPPHRLQRLVWVIVLNPREGDVALAVPRERRFGFGRRSVTPPDQQAASTLEGLPSHDTLPSPLPSPQRSVYHPTTPGSSCGCCVTRRW
jgi:hypothetical protein